MWHNIGESHNIMVRRYIMYRRQELIASMMALEIDGMGLLNKCSTKLLNNLSFGQKIFEFTSSYTRSSKNWPQIKIFCIQD